MADRNELETTHESRGRRTGFARSAQQALSFVAALMLLGAGTAHGAPDLVTVDVDASAVTTDSQTLVVAGNLQVSIQNIGDADVAAAFDVLVFEDLNGNGEFDGADQVLGTTSYAAGLLAATSTDVTVAVSGTVQFAGNLIYALADSGNVIAEDDETNNLRNTGQGSQFIPTPGPFSPVLEWSWDASNAVVLPDALNIMNTPVVIDLTGDGIPEVIFGSTASRGGGLVEVGHLRALNGADGSELFTVVNPDHRLNTAASMAAADIDGDGLPEIVAAHYSNNRVIAFEHDGTFKWLGDPVVTVGTGWGAVTIADLDQDGTPEILMGRQAMNNLGQLLWTGNDGLGNGSPGLGGMSLVADVDLDGSPEVVAGRAVYSNTGAIEATMQGGVGDGPNAVGDFDDDDFAEIVLVYAGRVYLFEHDGTLIWGPVAIPGGGGGGPPTIADYDNDGEPEIGVAGASRYVVLETDGSLKWAVVTQDSSSSRTGSSVFDFEGDGSAEVVYRDELKLRVYDGNNGNVLFETPMSSCTWHEYINVADVDADGNAEIIAVANDNCGFGPQRGVFIYGDSNDNWVPTRKIWNQHTYHITNVNADGTIPAIEQNNWQVEGLNNYRLNEFLPGEGTSADAPDLIPSFIRFDQQNCPEFVTLAARVGNGGSLLAPTGLNVSFYDGPPGAGGTLIGTAQTSFNLEPGQFEDVSVQWNAPPVGNAEVYVVADDDGAGNGTINEGNEDNNTASASEVLCSPVCIDNFAARPKPDKIQLTWTHVQGATYDVLRSAAVGGPFAQIASTDSSYSTYLDQPVDNGVPYYYQIRRMPGVLGENSCLSAVLGAVAPEGRRDRLTTVPDIREQSQAAAEAALAAANLGVGAVTLVASDTVPAGDVVDQDPPPNSVVPRGFAVAFSVSAGAGGPTNTLPIVDAGGDETITEGDTLVRAGSFIDPDADTWTATVNYGDGGGPEGVFLTPAKTFDLSHAYVDDGLFTVTVTVNDGTGPGSASFSVEVLNAAPQVEAGADRTITAGDSTSLDPATFTDAGIADTHTATIDWGDGTVEPGVVTQGAGSGTVAGSHVYAIPDTYVVTVTVTDNVGGSGSDTFSVLVNPVQVAVPDVVGLSQAAAEAAIVGANLTVGAVTTANSSTVPAGDVISQDPSAGTLVDESSPVDLVVSLGPPDTVVPDVVGLPQAAAEAAIVGANLIVGTVSTANSDTVPAGDVISQNPAGGTSVSEGSAVDLVVSLGPVQVTVPDVVGLPQAAAEAAIVAANLSVGAVTTANSDTVPAGDVISQDPAAGTSVDEFSSVEFVVSLGPVQVTVPDVVGLSQAAAEAAIVGANLTVGTVSTANSDTVPAGNVISQDPAAGTSVDEFSSVDLVVSLGPVQVTVPDVVGLSQAAAEAAIGGANLTVGAVTAANSDTVPEGDVISQNPVGGTNVDEFSPVDIVVSLGPLVVPVTVPDVVGLPQAAAEAAIVAADLTVGAVSTQNSATVPAGDVISQNPPAGASVAENSAVDIVVSLGPVTVTVPDVVGLTEAGAVANILAADLTVGTISTQSSDTVPAGDVISQNPAAGAIVAEGSAVDLVVSTGPASADDVPPVLVATLNAEPPVYNAGTNAVVTAVATDDSGVPPVITMTLDGGAIPVTLPDTFIDTTALAAGSSHTVVVIATDGASQSVSETLVFFVRDPSVSAFPTVALTAPANDVTISEPTDVIGTASDADLAEYTLEYAPIGTSDFAPFASGNTSVTADVLGQFDTSQVSNGTYTIRLTALNLGGNSVSISINVVVEGGAKLGQFAVSFTDKAISIGAFPLQVMRNYDSRDRNTQGDFGYGWGLGLSEAFVTENRVIGASWTQQSSGGFIPTYSLFESQSHVVTVKLEEGDEQRFRPVPDPSSQQLTPIQFLNAMNFTGIGAEGTLTPLGGSADFVLPGAAGPNEIFDGSFDLYQPSGYFYNAPDGFGYQFTRFLGGLRHKLTSITDPNGTTISLNPGGIIRSDGISIAFVRDGQGRITQITDPNGNVVTYSYDIRGDLVGVTDAEGNTTQFIYNSEHFLLEIRDPLGRPVQRQEYDADGRLIGITDANGERVDIEYDLNARSQIVRDRRGNPTIYEYDVDGNVTSQTDIPFVNGAATPVTIFRTYNASNLLTSETDPLGNVQSFTYDAKDNLLTRTDALGNTEFFAYNAKNQVLTNTDKRGNTTSNTYDANGRLLSTTDALGNVKLHTYNTAGNRLTTTDALGNVTTFTYDGNGRLLTRTDALGNVTTYEYDTNGNRTAEIDALGNRTEFLYDANDQLIRTRDALGNDAFIEYDALGRQIAEIDALGNRTETVYGSGGEIDRVDYPDGTSMAHTYDPDGNRATVTNRNGLTTAFTYDVLDKVVDVQFPDGSGRTKLYDAVSNLSGEVDELGNRTDHEYDAVGRRTLTSQPDGAETRYEYDANGNRTAVVDANGNRTEFTFDALNRQAVTTFPDANTATVTYDALGRELTKTDPMGNVTTYAYDANGKLTQVTDALGAATQYAYDAVGNMVTQTDANGNVTTFAYGALSRKLSRTLPLGQQELFTYDAAGRVVGRTDFNGNSHAFTYDEVGRQLTANYADGATVTTTYNGEGAPLTIVDSLGTTTQTYDNRGRLASRTDSAGLTVAYTYDATGQQSSVTSPGGAATSHTYDSLQRLSTTTDDDGGVTTYLYDAVGNLAEVQNPNGTEALYTYNARNQLTNLVNRDSSATVISSYAYTLNANGMRTRIDEGAGNAVDYVYDATMRLLRETRTGANAFDDQYTYDAVGNRLSVNRDGTVTNYTYDNNDRLLTAGTKTNAYDGNGNLVQVIDGVNVTTYEYDSLNRLTRTVAPGVVVTQYQYDAQGNRVTRRNGAGAVLARYALDTRSITGVPQILEERDAASVMQVHYTHGADLISQKRAATRSYYHYDGLGSARELSSAAEAVTDTYLYDAFGRQVATTGSTSNEFRYTGEQFDSTLGFYYLRARYYDQSNGRFISMDPFAGDPQSPMSLHRYLYANDNPVHYVDPNGQFGLVSVSISISISTNLRSVYTQNLVKFFLKALKIAYCVLEPAYQMQELAYTMIASNTPGGFELFQLSRNLIAQGYKAIGAEIVQTYKNIANDMVSVKFEIGGLLGDIINSAQSGTVPIPVPEEIAKLIEYKEKLEGWLDEFSAVLNDIETFVNGNNCQKFTVLANRADQIAGFIPSF